MPIPLAKIFGEGVRNKYVPQFPKEIIKNGMTLTIIDIAVTCPGLHGWY